MNLIKNFTKTKIIALAATLLLVGGGGAWLLNGSSNQTENKAQQVASEETKQSTDYVTYQGEEGKTALELLKSKADVETKQYDFGELVVSIDGNDGGGEKYWTFFVNGEMAEIGAGEYETKSSDVIEWKLQ